MDGDPVDPVEGADDGADRPADDTLVLPPIPLATGRLFSPVPGSPEQPVTSVELLVTTADGVHTRIPLVEQHGAWWPPAAAPTSPAAPAPPVAPAPSVAPAPPAADPGPPPEG